MAVRVLVLGLLCLSAEIHCTNVGCCSGMSALLSSAAVTACSEVPIFLCNCFKVEAGEKHCKPGNDTSCLDTLQTSLFFQLWLI